MTRDQAGQVWIGDMVWYRGAKHEVYALLHRPGAVYVSLWLDTGEVVSSRYCMVDG